MYPYSKMCNVCNVCNVFVKNCLIFMNKIKQNYQNYSLSRMKEILFNLE